MSVRRRILELHRWCGVILGPLVMLMAASGIGLIFRPQLEPLVQHDLMVVPSCLARLSLDELAERARARHPTGRVSQASIWSAADRSTMIRFDDNASLYLDPCTGRSSRRAGPLWRHLRYARTAPQVGVCARRAAHRHRSRHVCADACRYAGGRRHRGVLATSPGELGASPAPRSAARRPCLGAQPASDRGRLHEHCRACRCGNRRVAGFRLG